MGRPPRARLLAALRVSERVRRLVAALLEHSLANPAQQLLDDPEAGINRDVLLVLANYAGSWAATRRLPEDALRRLEADYVPQR